VFVLWISDKLFIDLKKGWHGTSKADRFRQNDTVYPRGGLLYKITIRHFTVVSRGRAPRLRHNTATSGSPDTKVRKLVVRFWVVVFFNPSGSRSPSRSHKVRFFLILLRSSEGLISAGPPRRAGRRMILSGESSSVNASLEGHAENQISVYVAVFAHAGAIPPTCRMRYVFLTGPRSNGTIRGATAGRYNIFPLCNLIYCMNKTIRDK